MVARSEHLQLVPLAHVAPLLPSFPDVLYEYTIPLLGNKTLAAFRATASTPLRAYRATKEPARTVQSIEERYLPPYEAARFVSSIYSRFLEPVRFAEASWKAPSRNTIFDGFARALLNPRVLPAVEMIAENVCAIRELDTYGADIGSNVVRWMEYLASEALESDFLQVESEHDSDRERLRSALRVIRDATSVLDRYRAMMREREGARQRTVAEELKRTVFPERSRQGLRLRTA